ncbi:MAG TPA: TIGR03560 family F420-dependent LLM class oxidoreductase [Candidatus Limnocylindria bacterium]|nr:TIGR03560 family F420-dependent LLM class oxidoreductase [Candidatus Limnocylindria bacterium]
MSFPVRFGLKLSQQVHPIDAQRDAWKMAEQAGFDHIWPFDHLIALGGDPTKPILDGWTVLGAIAEATTRVRLGLNVTGNLYRHPGLLAKIAVTVDHLSAGRLEFGIGAAWNEPEFKQQGLPFPSPADRIRMLDESIRAIKLLWKEPRATFKGRFYQFEDAIAEPKPVQQPHPPIWIGGSGPQRTLRVVARHADVWNGGGPSPEETKDLLRILDEHCAKVGRDRKTIRLSRNFRVDDADAALKQLEWSRALGYTEFLLFPGQGDLRAGTETAAKLLPRLRAAA